MSELNTRQRIALAEFLGSHFLKVRADRLNGEALAEMTVGERLAVKFGGQVAAWLSLPKPASRASVSNKELFTAWVEKHMPDEIETVKTVRPGTQKTLLDAAKANGGKWLNKATNEYVDIDGISFGISDPSPRVELTDAAAEAIGAAWRAGDIDLAPLLALPAPEDTAPGAASDVQIGKLVTVYQSRFRLQRAERDQMVAASEADSRPGPPGRARQPLGGRRGVEAARHSRRDRGPRSA